MLKLIHYPRIIGMLLAFALAPILSGNAAAEEAICETKKPIVFGGLDWDSNAFHTAVAQFIIKHGYNCAVDLIPGATIPLHAGIARGDIDVLMEVWPGSNPPSWDEGVAKGVLVSLGVNVPDAVQAWFVPRYLVEGENAPAKGLRSVQDLPNFKDVFRDPEEPGKGRFYNCIAGWQCEIMNTKKLHAYGLTEHFTNFRPGSGAALSAAIDSSIRRKRPVLFYYWGPTWLLGKIQQDVVRLEEPPYDEAKWNALQAVADPAAAKDATAYPVVRIDIGARADFVERAPKVAEFLKAYTTSDALVSAALAHMQESGGSAEDAARHFLTTNADTWRAWVPEGVAKRVTAELN
jgi:glycine betaine/proline transport system substrate-binding protein